MECLQYAWRQMELDIKRKYNVLLDGVYILKNTDLCSGRDKLNINV